ncbi:MAG: response regulator [Bacteroidota bacterium]
MNSLKSIFLVEDDKDDQFFFTQALSKIANANLFAIANNGKEAIDKLESSTTLPDIIFMDINMPLMNGIECLAEITKTIKTQHIPVVMLTTDTGSMEVAHQMGAKAFIKKPSNGKILREKLEQMINLDFLADSQIANQK